MLSTSGWIMHQYIEEALKHPSAIVLVRNFHCLVHGNLKNQLPEIIVPCPISHPIYAWWGSHAHHIFLWQLCPWLLEGQIAFFILPDPLQSMRLLLREGPKKIQNCARLRCICPCAWLLRSWTSCRTLLQTGTKYLGQRQHQWLPNHDCTLGLYLSFPIFPSTSLQILPLPSHIGKKNLK